MRKITMYVIGLFALALTIISCEDEEIGEQIDVAPATAVVDPGAIAFGSAGVELVASASDGVTSPLASGTITLLDSAGTTQIATFTQNLSGQSDTIRMAADVSDIENLPIGTYAIVSTAIDQIGLSSTSDTIRFDIFDSEFNANQAGLWVLGSFNGWGANTPDLGMTLIADNTWQVTGVGITAGDQFKFANTPDFSGIDFSDPECDGVVEQGISDNINCSFNGTFTITFNDETLEYNLLNTSPPATNFPDLYLLGSFNNFEGTDARFFVAEDNVWRIDNLVLSAGDKVKFSTTPDFSGDSYGDDEPDSIADRFGSNIMIMNDGNYSVTINDLTLEYEFLLDCESSRQDGVWILGQMNGWGANTPDLGMTKVDDDNWTLSGISATAGDAFKFANTPDFSGIDWGDDNCDGNAIQGTGANISCIDETGTYTITFNTCLSQYTITQE
ncbi:MAG: hypothetical protein AAFN93_03490 [Bacteroidota bacterium]